MRPEEDGCDAESGMSAATGDQPDGDVLDGRRAGPMASRMMLGALLRRLREARGITRGQAGQAIGVPSSKVSRLELGRIGSKPRDVADLLTFYRVTDESERATLLEVAKEASTPGWWCSYNDVISSWFEAYLGLEQAACHIRCYEVQFIPGLLQTEDYARAVIALGHGGGSREQFERRVQVRMHRQQMLYWPRAPQLWAVVDEAALRRAMGGTAAMAAQLEHLLVVSELPNVTVSVLPFSAGGHCAVGGPITLLRLPEPELPDVVYLEQLSSALYFDRVADVDYYRHILDRLAVDAASKEATTEILWRIRKEIRS
jgi:transcriptional regulator with XRE-family HTH domain